MSPNPVECAVLLVSGGLDSLLMMGDALRRGEGFAPIYVRQGAVWEDAEAAGLLSLLNKLRTEHGSRVGELVEMRLDFPPGYAARWAVDAEADVPNHNTPDKAVYLPGRNLALLVAGGMVAQSRGIHEVRIGTLDYNPFSDSTDVFISQFEKMFETATGWRLKVTKPLTGRNKAELMREGAGLPFELTSSCLRPAGGTHCGRCNKCAERRRAFAEAGMTDPTRYRSPSVK